jgi:hypothetical protein
MKRTSMLWIAALAAAACSDGPVGVGDPAISFTVNAPTEVDTKSVIDVEAQITTAARVQTPLTVVFEKANAGEPFFQVASYILQDRERIAIAKIPVLADPRIRITVRESSPAEFTVSKTIQVDVVDFP